MMRVFARLWPLWGIAALTAAVSRADADPVAEAFFDGVMSDMRGQASNNGLDPVRVMPFKVNVPSDGILNRKFKANFTQGSLYGLAGLSRRGVCSRGTSRGLIKIGCYVSLGAVRLMMNADVKGDQTFDGSKHAISTQTLVAPNSLVLVEFQGQRGGTPYVDRLTVNPVTMTTSVAQGKLSLNDARFKEFVRQVNQNLSNQLGSTLYGPYKHALQSALSRRVMP